MSTQKADRQNTRDIPACNTRDIPGVFSVVAEVVVVLAPPSAAILTDAVLIRVELLVPAHLAICQISNQACEV